MPRTREYRARVCTPTPTTPRTSTLYVESRARSDATAGLWSRGVGVITDRPCLLLHSSHHNRIAITSGDSTARAPTPTYTVAYPRRDSPAGASYDGPPIRSIECVSRRPSAGPLDRAERARSGGPRLRSPPCMTQRSRPLARRYPEPRPQSSRTCPRTCPRTTTPTTIIWATRSIPAFPPTLARKTLGHGYFKSKR